VILENQVVTKVQHHSATELLRSTQGGSERLQDLPFHEELTINVADSGYGKARYLSVIGACGNTVVVVRLAGNRKLYKVMPEGSGSSRRGHPKWFGEVFDLKDETTWGKPDEEICVEATTRKGKILRVTIERWHGLLMRGKEDAPMHNRPFDLVRCLVFDEGVKGSTSENWWEICCLAYIQLWLATSLSEKIPRPWEKYKPEFKNRTIPGPSQVQRDFARIVRAFGTPAVSPKPRGNSPGRKKGYFPRRRIPRTVVYKEHSPPKKVA